MRRWGFAIWLILATAPTSHAADQEPPRRHYTMASWTARDGMPASYVRSLAQDRDGFLWVGTTAGLSIFDGQRFTPWPRRGTFPSPNPVIYAITPTRDSVWVAFGGPSRLARDQAGHISVYTQRDGLPNGSMRALLEDHEGVVWAGSTEGLARFDGTRWTLVTGLMGSPEPGVTALTEDHDGRIWVSTSRGVFRLAADRQHAAPVRAGADATSNLRISNHDIVITSHTRIARLDPNTGAVRSERVTRELATGPFPVIVDRTNRTWVGTNGEGLFLLEPPESTRVRQLTERDGLAGDLIKDLLEDRDGNIWVGTQAGLTRITEATIASAPSRTGTSAENLNRLVASPDGTLWVQSSNGLITFTSAGPTLAEQAAGVPLQNISALHADRTGTLWIGTADGHILRRHGNDVREVAWPNVAAPTAILGIAADGRGRIWVHDGARLLIMDGTEIRVVEIPRAARDSTLRFLTIDSQGRPWLGVDGSVAVYERDTFTVYTEAHGLPAGQLAGALEDSSGRMWLATDNGLATLERGRIVTLTTEHGLPRNRIFFILEDDSGVLWLGTGLGVLRVDRGELNRAISDRTHRIRYRLFDASDGLKGTPVLRGQFPAARAADGSLWFITSNGLQRIDPRRVARAPDPPSPRLETIVTDGVRRDATGGLQLEPHLSSLQIEYAALNLTSPSKISFRHQLEGVDADWVDNGPNRQASYTNLVPGPYRFKVSASNGDGVWSEDAAIWSFTVLPTWYQTRTFYGGVIIALAAMAWGAWKLRVRQMRTQFDVVLAERARVGREIHDTLLQSLVGMSLQLDTLADQVEATPPPAVKSELSRMRRQVEHYIGEAQQSIWDLRSPHGDSGDLATTLPERAARITDQAGIAFDFTVRGTPRALPDHVRRQVLRIAQEAVVNAVRHAHPSVVRMELLYEGATVRVSVVDDGHGFNPNARHDTGESHWGMSIMRERAEQIGGRFSVTSSPEHGTRIDIVAPAAATIEAS